MLDLSTVLLDACDFSVFLLCKYSFLNGRSDGFIHHIRFFFVSVFPSLTTVLVVVTNALSVSSKSPLVFLTVILLLSDFSGNGSLIFEYMISVLDILYPVNYIIKVSF